MASGPLLLGARALGLGGAFVGIAEGVDGDTQNPASPAVRSAYSPSYVDFDAGLGVWFPGTLQSSDFFNTGRGATDLRYSDQEEFALLTPGVNVQLGSWGLGFAVDLSRYGLCRRSSETQESELVRAQVSTVRTYVARAFGTGDWVAGAGFHVTALDVTTKPEIFTRPGNLFVTRGLNMEGPALASGAPAHARGLPARRTPTSALQFGPKPLNVRWLSPAEARRAVRNAGACAGGDQGCITRRADEWLERRTRSWPRRYVLISFALHMEGRMANAVGVESFLQQRVDRSGEAVTFSPRLELETESFASWLRLRAGTYVEPSRFRGGTSRLHGTVGTDVRLMRWGVGGLFDPDTAWRLSFAMDRADEYSAWTAALGAWD
ncbi:MAG: hypothetical protein ACOC1F_12795 [Myxococcota bacterium]